MDAISKKAIVEHLKAQMYNWEGSGKSYSVTTDKLGLGEIEDVFPKGVFPLGCIHEFVLENMEAGASTYGFIGGLLGRLCGPGRICVWIGDSKLPFPASLKMFGINPHQIIFVDVSGKKDALWATEEALKCDQVGVVVSEVSDIDSSQARRLQLATEKNGICCFVLRPKSSIKRIPCTASWRISAMPSHTVNQLPGVGFYSWKVELTKVRNGNTGSWTVYWYKGALKTIDNVAPRVFGQQKVG